MTQTKKRLKKTELKSNARIAEKEVAREYGRLSRPGVGNDYSESERKGCSSEGRGVPTTVGGPRSLCFGVPSSAEAGRDAARLHSRTLYEPRPIPRIAADGRSV